MAGWPIISRVFTGWRDFTALRTGLLLLLMSLLALPAHAGPKRVLLIYGPGEASDAAEAKARKQAAGLLGDARKRARGVHISEIPVFSGAPMFVAGDVTVRECSGAELTAEEIRALVEKGRELTDLLEDAKAARAFDKAWQALLCSDAFVEDGLLYDLHFYLGVAAFVSGDKDAAGAAFTAAASVDPDRDFDARYPPEIETLYSEAHSGRFTTGSVRLRLQDPDQIATELRVDGRNFDRKKPALLAAGDHLLQYRTGDDAFISMGLHVSGEGEAVVQSSADVAGAILAPGRDEASMAFARAALAELATARRAGNVVVAVLDDSKRTFRYDPAEGTFEGEDLGGATEAGDDDDDDDDDDEVAPPRKGDGGTVAPPR
jgi:hypothetical protein